MRKIVLFGAIMLASLTGKSQFTQSDLIYYVGDGPDTAVIVIDFLDETVDTSYAWGFLFDATGSVTGEDALTAIAADEAKLDFLIEGGFLTQIHFNAHTGVSGDPAFWGIWSKTAETAWESNDGLAEVLANGDWWGCSYTDFDPAILPGEPLPAYESANYDASMIQFWVGEGADSAVLVVDFVVGPSGEAMTYAWGYRFDGAMDAETMLNDIAAADVNLLVNAGPFLDDIMFNGLAGLAADPHYWNTYSGTNLTDWTANAGIGTSISSGDWFGCSYDAWPARRPFNPISALDSADVPLSDVEFIFGTGENKAVLVIDFNEWLPGESYTFGYLFEAETITAQEVMIGLEDAEVFGLMFNLDGGFLNDISYGASGEDGIAGAPNYWSTWSAQNVGDWIVNAGITTEMSDGDWFGCSYSTWSPATPPSLPEVGFAVWGIDEAETAGLTLYPNPASKEFTIELGENARVEILNGQGKLVLTQTYQTGLNTIDVSSLAKGIYVVSATVNGISTQQKLIIQ
ncbi:MAG: T9SS type A sorting domain-containing protein [Crocinitomix sp.]|nr:T9SS type A sorting domain-containing protein [Crocinitomix sp.]